MKIKKFIFYYNLGGSFTSKGENWLDALIAYNNLLHMLLRIGCYEEITEEKTGKHSL